MNDRGRVSLQFRRPGIKSKSVGLSFDWALSDWADVALRVGVIAEAIAKAIDAGAGLKFPAQAANRANTAVDEDWEAALDAYRDVPQQRLKPQVWGTHLEVINNALEAFSRRNAPTNSADLIDLALKPWPVGTCQHQLMRQRICKFLRFCVERRQFKTT